MLQLRLISNISYHVLIVKRKVLKKLNSDCKKNGEIKLYDFGVCPDTNQPTRHIK